MDIYQSLVSSASVLNEQVARQIFKALPEQGIVIVIMDRAGNSWPSDTEEFNKLNISESFLTDICCRIDDGDEPVIAQVGQCNIVASQLATERINCGYLIIALPRMNQFRNL